MRDAGAIQALTQSGIWRPEQLRWSDWTTSVLRRTHNSSLTTIVSSAGRAPAVGTMGADRQVLWARNCERILRCFCLTLIAVRVSQTYSLR